MAGSKAVLATLVIAMLSGSMVHAARPLVAQGDAPLANEGRQLRLLFGCGGLFGGLFGWGCPRFVPVAVPTAVPVVTQPQVVVVGGRGGFRGGRVRTGPVVVGGPRVGSHGGYDHKRHLSTFGWRRGWGWGGWGNGFWGGWGYGGWGWGNGFWGWGRK